MYKTLIWCASAMVAMAALVAIVAVASASPEQHSAVANMQPLDTNASATLTEVVVQPKTLSDDSSPEETKAATPTGPDSQLEAYVLSTMRSWTPAVSQLPAVEYEPVAHDIASVIQTPDDGVLVAALGYWEGARYAAYVDDGRCNDPVWRKSSEGQWLMQRWGDCDGGHAHSIWQIHPIVDVSSPLYSICNLDAISVRVGAAKCALELAKRSLASTGNLSGYTGEFSFEHPKADKRLEFARRAIEKHPFVKLVQE